MQVSRILPSSLLVSLTLLAAPSVIEAEQVKAPLIEGLVGFGLDGGISWPLIQDPQIGTELNGTVHFRYARFLSNSWIVIPVTLEASTLGPLPSLRFGLPVPGLAYTNRRFGDHFVRSIDVLWVPISLVSFRPRPFTGMALGAIGFETSLEIGARMVADAPIAVTSIWRVGIEVFNYVESDFCGDDVVGNRLRLETTTRLLLRDFFLGVTLHDPGSSCPGLAQMSITVGYSVMLSLSSLGSVF